MKRLIIILLVSILAVAIKAQVYDGITQGTTYRILLPASTTLSTNKNITVSPLVGYKLSLKEWLSLTGIMQYNLKAENTSPQLWLNFSVRDKFFFLIRGIYDSKPEIFRGTLSATYKVTPSWHIDCTWENLYSDKSFFKNDRMQMLAGYDYKRFVFNAGYSCQSYSGFVSNVRFRIDKYNWLQMKYDNGIDALILTSGLNFN